MITPKFIITQNDEFVIVTIKVPYIRMSALEMIAEDCNFSLYCQPYLLKLTFAFPFREEDEECKATYDPFNDNGTLIAYLPKLVHGQHFPDLDLTTKLLQMSKKKAAVNNSAEKVGTIEVLNSEDFEMDEEEEAMQGGSLPSPFLAAGLSAVAYGFNNMYTRVFTDLRDELLDMTEIKHPDQIRPQYRAVLRISAENQLFDPARYLGDQLDGEMDPLYAEAMPFRPFYSEQWDAWKGAKKVVAPPEVLSPHTPTSLTELHGTSTDAAETATPAAVPIPVISSGADPRDEAFEAVGGFSEADREVLGSKLPNKEYLIAPGSREQESVLLGLVDILFAFCYDHRITLGESNVESAYTISRLSCTLSWLEDFSLMQPAFTAPSSASSSGALPAGMTEVKTEGVSRAVAEERVANCIKYSLRRCIIYPYLRVWKLARKVLADVAKILFLGKRAILKCLLQLRSTFEHTDTHYLLNKVFVDDYCVWVQNGLQHEQLQAFAKAYNAAKGSIEKLPHAGKELMGFFLPEIETWAQEREEEMSESDSDSDSDEEESDNESESESETEEEGDKNTVTQGSNDRPDAETQSKAVTAHSETARQVQQHSDELLSRAEVLTPFSTKSGQFSVAVDDGPGSTVAEGEEEWTVPQKYSDYHSLQHSDPRLRYLVVETALDSSNSAGNVGSIVNPAPSTSAALNDLLLMPKRKAEAELDALIAGPGASSSSNSKRPLIEEIAPRGPLIVELRSGDELSTEREPVNKSAPVEAALTAKLERLEIGGSSGAKK